MDEQRMYPEPSTSPPNPYTPDIIVGDCGTFKKTVENVESNVITINSSSNHVLSSIIYFGTERDTIAFRNNVLTTMSGAKTVVEDTRSILRNINIKFPQQTAQDQNEKAIAYRKFHRAVQSFAETQLQVFIRVKHFLPVELCNTGTSSTIALQYGTGVEGNDSEVIVYRSRAPVSRELQTERETQREEVIRKLESDVADLDAWFEELTDMPIIQEQLRMIENHNNAAAAANAAAILNANLEPLSEETEAEQLSNNVCMVVGLVVMVLVLSGCLVSIIMM